MGSMGKPAGQERGRGERPAPLGAGAPGKQSPSRQGEEQVRTILRLPRWRGRQHGRHELTAEDAATAAWVHGLGADPGQGSMSLADELAARRTDRAALAIEREYHDTAELSPANTDTRLPPGWHHWKPPAELVDEDQAAEVDEYLTTTPGTQLEIPGTLPDAGPGLGAVLPAELVGEAVQAGGELVGGLGARHGQIIMLAARILDEAGTVDGALELAAGALRVLGEIDQATREGLDEDTRKLGALLGGGELVELDEHRGDA